MKSLQDYAQDSQDWIENPSPGDDFDIELAPDRLLESYVMERDQDDIVIYADEAAMTLLEQHGLLDERIATYGPASTTWGMGGRTLAEKDVEEDLDPGQYLDGVENGDLGEGRVKELDIERQDYERMTPQQFYSAYKITKDQWARLHQDLIKDADAPGTDGQKYMQETSDYFARILELAGCQRRMEEDQDAEQVATKELDSDLAQDLGEQAPDIDNEEEIDAMDEAKYQGREVPLGKPMRGDVKKFKVYVRDPKTGNIKKVNFGHGGTSAKRAGQKTMRIKKSDPARRRSFRARHHCENPGPRTKARYWSCRAW